MGSELFYSNRIETLASRFADSIRLHIDPFPPMVIIPNPYTKKWLQMSVASRNGIATHMRFAFLDKGLWDILHSIDRSAKSDISMLERDDMQLLILHMMQSTTPDKGPIKTITRYLYDSRNEKVNDHEKKLWQLSERLAGFFMEYEYQRYGMIRLWMQNKLASHDEMEKAEQFIYWEIFKKNGIRDSFRPGMLTLPQYSEIISLANPEIQLPRIYFFCTSPISPFHASLIHKLGRCCEIEIYYLNPCYEFWEDIRGPYEEPRGKKKIGIVTSCLDGEELSCDEFENNLLKLWGKPGRETIKMLSALEEEGSKELRFESRWLPHEHEQPDTVLHILQNQILKKSSVAPESQLSQDTSLQIVSCPDIFREVESVYNSVLSNLEHDDALLASDIAIMVPEMERYAPVIKSVFLKAPRSVTFSIIDSTATSESVFGNGLMAILRLKSGEFTRSDVFNLIFNPCFQKAFNISYEDAQEWLQCINELNIFRGHVPRGDGRDTIPLYSWDHGLARLRLGRIMENLGRESSHPSYNHYAAIVPFSGYAGRDPLSINKISYAIEVLQKKIREIEDASLSGTEWIAVVQEIISLFLKIPDSRPEELIVRDRLFNSLKRFQMFIQESRFSIDIIREYVKSQLNRIPCNYGNYLASGVNVSGLIPRREIPFKIIYILGMEEGLFPGLEDVSSLNLMANGRKIGDISKPDANRYIFLETLLSVREKLYITFVSRDLQRDQEFHPNSIIGQLISYLEDHVIRRQFSITGVPLKGYALSDRIVQQGCPEFSDFVFSMKQGKLEVVNYSSADKILFSRRSCPCKKSVNGSAIPSGNSLRSLSDRHYMPGNDLAEGQNRSETMSLIELRNFIVNPIESSLKRHLRIYDDINYDLQGDKEPFYSENPFYRMIITDVLHYYVIEMDLQRSLEYCSERYKYFQLQCKTPAGAFGQIDLDDIRDTVKDWITYDSGTMSLIDFLQRKRDSSFIRSAVIGRSYQDRKIGRLFPSIQFNVKKKENEIPVTITGSLTYLWKNENTGCTEVLVFTMGNCENPMHVILPFLFYVSVRSGYNDELKDFIGEAPFLIHISARNGIRSYSYQIDSATAKRYMYDLVMDFLDDTTFDMLPFSAITGMKDKRIDDMNENASEEEKSDFRNGIISHIDEEIERGNQSFSMELLDLINTEIPLDAYEKVSRRYKILMKPVYETKIK